MIKNKITLNVLADITKRIGKVDSIPSTNRMLVVFTGSNMELKSRIEELARIKKRNIDFSLAFSFMGERVLDINSIADFIRPIEIYKEEDIFQLENIVENYSSIVGINITMNTLSKVSLGMIDSFISNIIWAFLHKNKPVYIDFEAVRNYLGSPIENKEIKKITENYIETWKRMGVTEINEGGYGEQILKIEKNDIWQEKDMNNKKIKKVITEKDLRNYNSKESVILPKGTIITPLAKDRAKELGIKLEIER